MKLTTHIAAYAQNIGKPEESLRIEGAMKDVASQLVRWLAERTMAKKIRIEIGRSQQELGLKQAKQDELDSLCSEVFAQLGDLDGQESQEAA